MIQIILFFAISFNLFYTSFSQSNNLIKNLINVEKDIDLKLFSLNEPIKFFENFKFFEKLNSEMNNENTLNLNININISMFFLTFYMILFIFLQFLYYYLVII